MPKLGLNRQQLSSFLKNQESIVAFEQLFDFSAATPATIEEAAALAGTAAAIANQALSMLASYAELLEQLSAAPAHSAPPEPDNFTPAIAPQTFGSLGEQDAAAVAITGGTMANVSATKLVVDGDVGVTPLVVNANAGAIGLQIKGRSDHLGFIEFFKNDGTTLEGSIYGATGKIVLTGPSGADALSITAAGVAAVGAFGTNGKAAQPAYALGTASTDLATVITLANNIRSALIANGIGS